ncbi:MAG: TIGR03936 family radical SAM-associated protein [Planctomycetota bacterium]|jgi:radical SAM-linked protein
MVVLVRFSITGSLRFLSHAETLRMFNRACIRADLPLLYSLGFNPHPKISLPCPRSVGIEALEEVLVVELNPQNIPTQPENIILKMKNTLSQHLPEDCHLLSVDYMDGKSKLHPYQVSYLLKTKKHFVNESFRSGIETLRNNKHLPFRRYTNKKNQQYKDLDLRPFLKSIDLDEKNDNSADINIVCKVTSDGSIRVDEIMNLLHIGMEDLSEPVCRTGIKWN